jgi:hypothetical protein|nr:MAG TPA: hypothetical protein [Caudoviricetes sp.]
MKNNELEERLLNNASIDELIKMKIEKEFIEDLKKSKEKIPPKEYTDIKNVPSDKIFSKLSVYRYFNRKTKCETFVNGVQADALIGIQNNIREKMLKGELNAFTTENAYVKFEKAVF